MRHPFSPPLIRLGVRPDDPIGAPVRSRGSRRPHSDERVAQVRRLIEQSTLTYAEIEKRTGVGRASICRWTRDGAWQRPAFAPRATDTVPRPRAGQKLKLRLLAERLRALAERYVRELEESANVDPDKLMQALEVVKMARLEAMGRRRRRRIAEGTQTGAQWIDRQDAIRTALRELRRGGVDIDRAPPEAIAERRGPKKPSRLNGCYVLKYAAKSADYYVAPLGTSAPPRGRVTVSGYVTIPHALILAAMMME